MATLPIAGHCMCGEVRYSVSREPKWVGHCHCGDCRRHVASAVATFLGCEEEAFELTSGALTRYESSPGVERMFCGSCGTPMAYQSKYIPGEIHILLGTLEQPEQFPPVVEVFCKEKLPWLKLEVDGLSFDTLPETPG